MRVYKTQHQYYCGVDLHARSLFVNVLDDRGTTRFEQDLPANPAAFLDAVKPYRDGLVVGCECLFAWYWLADLCERESIPFTEPTPFRPGPTSDGGLDSPAGARCGGLSLRGSSHRFE